jgi:hypothetical protein
MAVALGAGVTTLTRRSAETRGSTHPGRLASEAVNVLDKGAVGDGVTDSTQAFINALATGRPVYVPGTRDAIYLVDDLSAGFTNNSVMFGDATIRLRTPGKSGIIVKTAISGFRLDGLTFDAEYKAITAVRFVDCTDFDLGTTTFTRATYAGLDLQECVDFRATALTANDNGTSGGQVGSGVYLREKTGGIGCRRFDLGTIRGNLNGLGPGLDGDTVHTSGSACNGRIGRVFARNGTRYGAKFQHTGGLVQVGQIIAIGNATGVSASGCNGLSVSAIHCDSNNSIGLWIDAGAQNVRIGSATILNSGLQGCQVLKGAADLTINDLYIRSTGTALLGGSNSRGFDCRGLTRGKIGNLTVIDAGTGPLNTSEAIYCSGGVDLQLSNVTVSDTRGGTARVARSANFSTLGKTVRITDFRASNCQVSEILGRSSITVTKVSVDGQRTYGGT